tara:strand:- start:552 stop:875 length:324 start_codon:yes stop_codon:yes gene_type:complete
VNTLFDNGTHKAVTSGRLPTEAEISYKGSKLTRRAFMQRFTQPERTLIRRSTDDIVIDIYEDLQSVNNVDLSLQDTINAIAYLTSVNILLAGRGNEILNNPVTEDET